MPSTYLTFYEIVITKNGHRVDKNSLGANNLKLKNLLKNFIVNNSVDTKQNISYQNTDNLKSKNNFFCFTPNIIELTNNKDFILSGISKYGYFGIKGEGFDNTGSKKFLRTKEDTELTPFYYTFFFPDQDKRAYLMTSVLGNIGIISQLKRILKKDFDNLLNSHNKSKNKYLLNFNKMYLEELMEAFIEENNPKLKKMSFTQRKTLASLDIDKFPIVEENVRGKQIIIEAKHKLSLLNKDKILNLFKDNNLETYFIQNDIEYDNIKLEMHLENGQRKTYNFKYPESFDCQIKIDEMLEVSDIEENLIDFDEKVRERFLHHFIPTRKNIKPFFIMEDKNKDDNK